MTKALSQYQFHFTQILVQDSYKASCIQNVWFASRTDRDRATWLAQITMKMSVRDDLCTCLEVQSNLL
jgi:hypothetical protein